MRARYWTGRRPTVNAFDTETRHGDLLLLCDPKHYLEVKPGTQLGHLLNFLWRDGRRENFFWNVGYDLGAILKRHLQGLSASARRSLRHTGTVRHGRFRLKFVGATGFRIRDELSHREKRYWDIAPFFSEGPNLRALDDVAREKFGEGKLETVDRRRLGREPGYYEAHRDLVIEYCMRDALLTRRLAEARIDEIAQALGFYSTRYSSKASLSKAFLEKHHAEVLAHPVPKPIAKAFKKGYRGGVFHTRVLGRVPHQTEIDIRGAFPSVIAELPDLRRLEPSVSTEYHPEAVLGVYKIEVEYQGDLPLDRGKGKRIVYPRSRGPRKYWATLPELSYLIEQGRPFTMRLAYEYFGERVPAFPGFAGLYARRMTLVAGEQRDLAFLVKTVMNACYGVLAESKHGETNFTNWVYAATITGAVRARIWSLCAKIGWERVVSINADSIRFIGPSPWYEAHKVELTKPAFGNWAEKFVDATVTHLMSGIAIIEEKGRTPELRKRGFRNLTVKMLRRAKGHRLSVPRTRPVKLLESLARGRVDDLGDFQNEERVLDLRSNLQALDFPEEKLTFEYLNCFPLEGANPDYDEVAVPGRRRDRLPHQRGARFRRQGARDETSGRASRN